MGYTKHSKVYVDYLKSQEWRIKATGFIAAAGYCCQRCGVSIDNATLQVHHLNYDCLGIESVEDVQVLCTECHKIADGKRKVKSYDQIWHKRLDAWATAKYGYNWSRFISRQYVENEFLAYLDYLDVYG